ncbi:MAG: hypothetical protein WD200_00590 [Candidatus Andersenbacteria bacterium]
MSTGMTEIVLPWGVGLKASDTTYLHRGYQEFPQEDAHLNRGLVINESNDLLFELFLDLLCECLAEDVVDVTLTRFYKENTGGRHFVAWVDSTAIHSCLCKFEELLVDDGALDILIEGTHPSGEPLELQLSSHKTITVAGSQQLVDLMQSILRNEQHALPRFEKLETLQDIPEHYHLTATGLEVQFEALCLELGAWCVD